MEITSETIAALATPPGRGGVGIIRISGPLVLSVIEQILQCKLQPRYANYTTFFDQNNEVLDNGLAIFFAAPNSFTGEDVLELQGHGGPVIMDLLLKRVIALGARLARPGEFSERAFLNDKIDLTQAEAIADLIDSASQQAARLAVRSLQGEFSKHVQSLLKKLIHLRMYVESAIDFPEEEIDFLADQQISNQLSEIISAIETTLSSAKQGQLLREGMTIVIAGQPNAGKSTLLNRLTGEDTAIVTEIAGTTRDVLRAEIQLDGLPVHVIDTAGLRDSDDPVEQEGIRRAWNEIQKADQIVYLYVGDYQNPRDQANLKQLTQCALPISYVENKIDISGRQVAILSGEKQVNIALCAKSGKGVELLRQHLKGCVGYQSAGEGRFMARQRHVDALSRALEAVKNGEQQLRQYAAGELLAEELRSAQHSLSEITGEFSSDDLLGKIFSSFCIGK